MLDNEELNLKLHWELLVRLREQFSSFSHNEDLSDQANKQFRSFLKKFAYSWTNRAFCVGKTSTGARKCKRLNNFCWFLNNFIERMIYCYCEYILEIMSGPFSSTLSPGDPRTLGRAEPSNGEPSSWGAGAAWANAAVGRQRQAEIGGSGAHQTEVQSH